MVITNFFVLMFFPSKYTYVILNDSCCNNNRTRRRVDDYLLLVFDFDELRSTFANFLFNNIYFYTCKK